MQTVKKKIKESLEEMLNNPIECKTDFINEIQSGLLRNHIRKLHIRLCNYEIKQKQLEPYADSTNVKKFFAKLRKNINGLYKRINTSLDFVYSDNSYFGIYVSPYILTTFSVDYMANLIKENKIEIKKEGDMYYVTSILIPNYTDNYTKEQCMQDWLYFSEMIEKVLQYDVIEKRVS